MKVNYIAYHRTATCKVRPTGSLSSTMMSRWCCCSRRTNSDYWHRRHSLQPAATSAIDVSTQHALNKHLADVQSGISEISVGVLVFSKTKLAVYHAWTCSGCHTSSCNTSIAGLHWKTVFTKSYAKIAAHESVYENEQGRTVSAQLSVRLTISTNHFYLWWLVFTAQCT